MRKAATVLALMAVLSQPAFAGFKEHYDLGQQYLTNYQYSGAITEFKSALRINYLDNSARIGLINSYLARSTHYANKEKNWGKAADDLRAALFYMVYYPSKDNAQNSAAYVPQTTKNLNICLTKIGFDMSPKSRFEKAKELRAEGNFAAAGYEFNQTLSDKSYIKDAFEQTGDIMKLLGNDPKAAEFYKKAVTVDPTNIALRLNYAKILDKLGDNNAAVEEYNYILSKNTDNKEVLYSLERIYKKKLEENPNDADITSNLGAIMQKQGKMDEALTYYRKAEYINPSNINTRLNVGTLYQQKGDYRTAITAYDSILILYPDNVNANLYKAQCQAALGDNKAALASFKKVLALDPANSYAQNQMFDVLKTTMTTTQFVDYVKKNMAKSNPADIIYNYALDLHKQNKLDDSIALYQEVIKLNTQNPEVYVNLAIAQSQQQNYEQALATLTSAQQKFPSNNEVKKAINSIKTQAIDTKLAKAAEYFNNKDYENAINEYLAIQPPTADSMLGAASAYQNMNDTDNAITYYKKAFDIKPSDSDIAYYIGALYAEKGELENAKTYLNKSISLNKNNAKSTELLASVESQANSAMLNDAITLYDNGQYAESKALLTKVVAGEPQNAYAYYYLGMICDAENDKNAAINYYKKAIAADSTMHIVNYMIAVDYDTMEQYKYAYQYYLAYAGSDAAEDEYKTYAKTRAEELKDYAK